MKYLAFGKLDAFSLKIIALAAMAINHVGSSLLDDNLVCDIIGRIAFPIFSFIIVESFFHTKNRRKFIQRLAIFAFISEIPFDLGIYHMLIYVLHQNVMFTLLLGVIMMTVAEKAKHPAVKCVIAAAFCALAWLIKCDYGYFGIIIIFIFYIFKDNIITAFGTYSLANIAIRWGTTQVYSIAAFAFIGLYNGKTGIKRLKYMFYVFYPAHLLVIYILYRVFKQEV